VRRKPRHQSLEQIFQAWIADLALTTSPHSYRASINNLLRYLAIHYPQIHTLGALRRDPHILGWLRHLAAKDPPLSKATRRLYLLCARRLLTDLAASGQYALHEGLILEADLPRPDHCLPKPLPPEDDARLQQHLRAHDDLRSNALLLLRHTGMRIGELLRLPADCLRHLGEEQWALHVPLGKLHTERWVPVDEPTRELYARLLRLRQERATAESSNFLLPYHGHWAAYHSLRRALKKAAQQAGCSRRVTPHQLRHTYATEMLRAGASLPAVMHLLGHKSVNMTLRYIQVTQNDLQREYHRARQNIATLYAIPELPSTRPTTQPIGPTAGILKSLAAARHLVEMFRRRLTDERSRRKIARLANRLLKIAAEFHQFTNAVK
jgi:site-specific recombinase XerD